MDVDSDAVMADNIPMLQQQQWDSLHNNVDISSGHQPAQPPAPQPRETFRDIQVKVHIRRPDRDTWVYLGRALVSQEVAGQSSRVVVRSLTSGKTMVVFGEASEVRAEKRRNFIVVGAVEGSRVISWSLNALNNSDTLRLLASIEIACYRSKQLGDVQSHERARRRIERVIKDDRRRRHRRRRDQDAMFDAFSKQHIGETEDVPES